MARGSKEAYTDKQQRQAEHIEDSYKKRGVSADTAEARAWATVNKTTGGGKKSGSGRGAAKRSASKSRSRKSGARKSPSRTRKTAAKKSASGGRKTARKTTTASRTTARKRAS